MFGMPTRHVRLVVQWTVFCLWVALIYVTHHPMDSWLAKHIPVSLLLRIDPLVMTVITGGLRMGVTIALLGLVTLGVTLLLGRVFCGWVCPLGAIFDAYGWVLKRLRVRFEGPSPSWYRFKFYLLLAIILFSIMGAVGPLMGLDPIVLVTRVMATIVNPFWRNSDEIVWATGKNPANYGNFIDAATLILFLAIMSATTRLSRIWCRTACPLGAYLAVMSRHATLRRVTEGCVHCNICANHCPTGAISFQNPEIYTESECIKCFACSQDCPVDANFFTYKNPIPVAAPEYAPVNLERRQLMVTAGTATLAAATFGLSAGEGKAQAKMLMRPPMSREERDFLLSCIRCNECTKACPTGIIKPAGLEFGIRALWTPVMTPTEGFCKEGCNACSQACPTDAIMKYPIEEKYKFKVGTAVFNSSSCVSYTENKFCSECIRVCPTNAIEYKDGWKPEGGLGSEEPAPEGQTPSRPYHVNYDRCVGCGACEYACNQIVYGPSAMITTSYGRAIPTTGIEPKS